MKTVGQHKYSITNKFEVEIWHLEDDETATPPWLRQPGAPGKENFSSISEAELWAEEYLLKFQNLIPEVPQPTVEEPPVV